MLWLGNSEDAGASHGGSIPVARRHLEALTGETVEITARVIWPSDALPGIIADWLDRYQPDVVMFKLDAYWYLFPSLPLRVENLAGRLLGKHVRKVGESAARREWLSRSAPYRWLQKRAIGAIGQATFFSPQEVAQVTERCIRTVVAREDIGLTVWGQTGPVTSGPAGAQEYVYRRIQGLCSQLRVLYVAWDPATPQPPKRNFHDRDPLHRNAAGHAWFGEREARSLKMAWDSVHTGQFEPRLALDLPEPAPVSG